MKTFHLLKFIGGSRINGESTVSVQHVRKWYKKFRSGRENIVDESCSGRSISITDKMLENKVDTIIQCKLKSEIICYCVPSECGI